MSIFRSWSASNKGLNAPHSLRIFQPESSSGDLAAPEVALLVSSYDKPDHLRKCLASITLQEGLDSDPEVVITDDGSDRTTLQVVEEFAAEVGFPTTLTTHRHVGYQLTRCRNDGVRASRAPYLLFLDGDCVLPPDHVAIHLELRKPRVAMSGDCSRLDERTSRCVTLDAVRSGAYQSWGLAEEQRRLARRHRAVRFYRWLRHPRKPTLIGNNIGIWRSDYEKVNGYDEEFEGWGCEDDDLARRLRRLGMTIGSVLHRTHTYHLWHPIDVTAPKTWKEGANVQRLLADRPAVCQLGLNRPAHSSDDCHDILPMYRDDTVVRRFNQPDSQRSTVTRRVA